MCRALYSVVQSSVMVSSWMRLTCRAFSRAIAAKSASASSNFKSRASNPSGPMQLINSMTPKHVSRNFTGTATIDCVSVLVFSSTCEKNRVSLAVSGTTTVSPCAATQPAIPCPIFTRTSFSACEAVPTASSKYNSCFASSSNSNDQLSGRRNSSIFSMIVRSTWSSCSDEVSAFPSSWKTATSPASRRSEGSPGLRRRSTFGNCLVSSTLDSPIPFSFGGRANVRIHDSVRSFGLPAFHRQYRRAVKTEATCPWYRRCYLAIHAWSVQMHPQSFLADFRSICFLFMGLTPHPRDTYSASWQDFMPTAGGAFPACGTADSAKIEDRYHEMAKGTFGERLKRERELREVSLNEIATATRIAPKFLEALENEQWNKLPGGVFGHGFVRSIARYLGLNEEDLLSEYDLARAEAAAPAEPKPEDRIPSPPKWIPAAAVLLLVAVLAGLFFGGRYAWRIYSARRGAKKSTAVGGVPAAAESKTFA